MTTPTQGEIYESLMQYAANIISSSDIADKLNKENSLEVATVLKNFIQEWEAAPCDEEGANNSQEDYLDAITENAAKKLLNL